MRMVGEGDVGWVEDYMWRGVWRSRERCVREAGDGGVEARELGWRKDRWTRQAFYIGEYSVNIFIGARIMNCGENLPNFHRRFVKLAGVEIVFTTVCDMN